MTRLSSTAPVRARTQAHREGGRSRAEQVTSRASWRPRPRPWPRPGGTRPAPPRLRPVGVVLSAAMMTAPAGSSAKKRSTRPRTARRSTWRRSTKMRPSPATATTRAPFCLAAAVAAVGRCTSTPDSRTKVVVTRKKISRMKDHIDQGGHVDLGLVPAVVVHAAQAASQPQHAASCLERSQLCTAAAKDSRPCCSLRAWRRRT